jgi:hypothetical protein
LYYTPGLQPGYSAYSPFLPGALVGADGQYLGQHAYFPSPMFPQPVLSPGYYSPSVAYGPDLVPGHAWDASYLYGDRIYGNSVFGDSTIPASRGNLTQAYHPTAGKVSVPSKSVNSFEAKKSTPARVVSPSPAFHSQTAKPANKVIDVKFVSLAFMDFSICTRIHFSDVIIAILANGFILIHLPAQKLHFGLFLFMIILIHLPLFFRFWLLKSSIFGLFFIFWVIGFWTSAFSAIAALVLFYMGTPRYRHFKPCGNPLSSVRQGRMKSMDI